MKIGLEMKNKGMFIAPSAVGTVTPARHLSGPAFGSSCCPTKIKISM